MGRLSTDSSIAFYILPKKNFFQVLPEIPVVIPLTNGIEIDYALVNTSSYAGMSGYHYSDNHFSGSSTYTVVNGE